MVGGGTPPWGSQMVDFRAQGGCGCGCPYAQIDLHFKLVLTGSIFRNSVWDAPWWRQFPIQGEGDSPLSQGGGGSWLLCQDAGPRVHHQRYILQKLFPRLEKGLSTWLLHSCSYFLLCVFNHWGALKVKVGYISWPVVCVRSVLLSGNDQGRSRNYLWLFKVWF